MMLTENHRRLAADYSCLGYRAENRSEVAPERSVAFDFAQRGL
jgi:hypothetical protein